MAQTHAGISSQLKSWIEEQPMYFLASAPLQADGHINLSPRGLDSLRVISENEIIILDLTGSGNETAAHLQENGRMTVMFCAFAGDPRILRLYGTGQVIHMNSTQWPEYIRYFTTELPGIRQIFYLKVSRIQTSCGFGVPQMTFVEQRDLLPRWATKKGHEGIREYQFNNNRQSIDGLPAPGMGQGNKD